MSIYKALQQRRLHKIQEKMTLEMHEDPYKLDTKAWKKLWKVGVKIEASYVNGTHWNYVTPYAEDGKGISFKHGEGSVKFRRKK